MALTVLGCGALGTAILSGILSCPRPGRAIPPDQETNRLATLSDRFPSRFFACVRRSEAAEAVKKRLISQGVGAACTILMRENRRGVDEADMVILACQPSELVPLLDEPGLKEALADKLVVSVLAGVTPAQIEAKLNVGRASSTNLRIVKAMPNTACLVGESMTVIERPSKRIPAEDIGLVEDLFRCTGTVSFSDPSMMDTCTALCGSTPAFFAVFLDSLVDGAVALGLNRAEAEQMAAQAMKGTAESVLHGQSPMTVRNHVASPGGSTMQGLLKLEAGCVRSLLASALQASTAGATGLARHGC